MKKERKAVYTNDRKAPRMRKARFSTHIVTKELWKIFIVTHPQYRNLSWKEFRGAWLEIAKTLRDEFVTNPLGVKLGGFAGEIKLSYIPYKFRADDPLASEELGKKSAFLNIDEKGKVGKIKWERRWAVKFNRMLQFFCFTPTREINKMAKEHIDKYPERVRTSRMTRGGGSVWDRLKHKV